jgi:hypothetical protein
VAHHGDEARERAYAGGEQIIRKLILEWQAREA